MVQLLQNLADEFADFAQGMVRGNPLLRMNVRKHPALILRPSAHLQSSRRIRGELNHHSFALARFFSKLLELLDDLPPVLGDRVQLQQVLLNLLTNAIDAMVSVADRPHVLGVRSEHLDNWVLISVQDSGTGIPSEYAERKFDAFFTTKPNGIGLGLPIFAR